MSNNLSFDWLSKQIVKENSDAIMFADREGAIRLWRATEQSNSSK